MKPNIETLKSVAETVFRGSRAQEPACCSLFVHIHSSHTNGLWWDQHVAQPDLVRGAFCCIWCCIWCCSCCWGRRWSRLASGERMSPLVLRQRWQHLAAVMESWPGLWSPSWPLEHGCVDGCEGHGPVYCGGNAFIRLGPVPTALNDALPGLRLCGLYRDA